MNRRIYAANWKMHMGPSDARAFVRDFMARHPVTEGKDVWIFPPAVAVEAVATAARERADMRVGVQNVYWEAKGAFTGEISVGMASDAGATTVLVGHSERRHVFGESDEETAKKIAAVLETDMIPVLCVGETIAQREAGETTAVVTRQLGALDGLGSSALRRVIVAYEPVWAIGTGHTATPEDANAVHREIRADLVRRGASGTDARILYGGSVKPANAEALLAESDIDGVLVGGASLDAVSWAAICAAGAID